MCIVIFDYLEIETTHDQALRAKVALARAFNLSRSRYTGIVNHVDMYDSSLKRMGYYTEERRRIQGVGSAIHLFFGCSACPRCRCTLLVRARSRYRYWGLRGIYAACTPCVGRMLDCATIAWPRSNDRFEGYNGRTPLLYAACNTYFDIFTDLIIKAAHVSGWHG